MYKCYCYENDFLTVAMHNTPILHILTDILLQLPYDARCSCLLDRYVGLL